MRKNEIVPIECHSSVNTTKTQTQAGVMIVKAFLFNKSKSCNVSATNEVGFLSKTLLRVGSYRESQTRMKRATSQLNLLSHV